jgi:hypothetical protein
MKRAWLLALPVLLQVAVADASSRAPRKTLATRGGASVEQRAPRVKPLRTLSLMRQEAKRVKTAPVKSLSKAQLYRRIGREQRRIGQLFALSWGYGIVAFGAAASTLAAFTVSAAHGTASLVVLGASALGFIHTQRSDQNHQIRENEAWAELERRGVQTY